MATTFPGSKGWLAGAGIALLATATCLAQQPAGAAWLAAHNQQAIAPTTHSAADSPLPPGEYITDKGWGRLLIKQQNGILTFSLESTTGEDVCELNGAIEGHTGVAKGNKGQPTCQVKFASTPQGIDVAAATPTECKTFCGYNGDFEAPYLRVKDGCGRDALDRTRTTFQRLYDAKDYKAALATLSPVVPSCLPTLEWEDEGAVRNDLAITQYKNGLYAQCLSTLDKYAEDAAKDDDAAVEGWTPVLADRYLAIVRAARTNIGLCRKGVMKR
ncbi:hypothetical protein [Xanthomonas sacchari]|uniref:Uncharacterized protein n=1 Tax=Xanthomonas sacchari TaxID=56458 RepID=A0A2P5YZZ5_9XANT|nr:hypothetical protein [Xanthomonas sacchari]MDV0440329.1 hypothetical protein [Xanthomonas sacchari]PPU80561.1 hypothetical protein XsacCFBP4641_18115 [Xanthomonas sacchari]